MNEPKILNLSVYPEFGANESYRLMRSGDDAIIITCIDGCGKEHVADLDLVVDVVHQSASLSIAVRCGECTAKLKKVDRIQGEVGLVLMD